MNSKYDFIYKTRKTGRIGNESFEYVYWLLRALNDGKLFECTYSKLYFPFCNGPGSILIPRKLPISFTTDSDPAYPIDISIYLKHKDLIKSFVKVPDIPMYDGLVIHLRLDDIDTAMLHYLDLSDEFYERVLKQVPKDITKVTIIGHAIDESQSIKMTRIKIITQMILKNAMVSVFHDNDLETDLRIIGSARYFIASTSTFWFWPAFLSENVERIWYPDAGLSLDMNIGSWSLCVPCEVLQ
jgi:hypothetical protein